MSSFNSDFWEVTLSDAAWSQFTQYDHLYYQAPDSVEHAQARRAHAQAVWRRQIEPVLDDILSARQRDILILYFFDNLTQQQIAQRLGITQQTVSEHLFGQRRRGVTVGGAIRKLRKYCLRHDIVHVPPMPPH